MPETNPEASCKPVDGSHATPTANASSDDMPKVVGRRPARLFRRVGRLVWYSLKKGIYLAGLIAIVGAIFLGLNKLAEVALKQSPLGAVYPEDFTMAKRDFTHPVSHYDYDLTPGICLVYQQVKGNRYEYANNAGFRDPRAIALKKPDDEYRIFLTGGSTAFGLGAGGQAAPITSYYYLEQRDTIAYMLERILEATAPVPGKRIRVYNTAVWGYSYQHLLFRYITKLRQYKPDLIVSLDGANEIHPVSVPAKEWNYFQEGQFNHILRQIFAYNGPGLSSYLTLWLKNNTFLMAFLWKGMDPFFTMEAGKQHHQGTAPGQDARDSGQGLSPEERLRMLGQNVQAVVRVIEDYHSVLENDGVPHLFAVQPLLYLSKKPRHEMEKQIESLGEHGQYYGIPTGRLYESMIKQITESARSKPYALADFSRYFDDTAEWVFTDWCHLTVGANYLIAKELANVVKGWQLQKPLTDGDKIENPDSFFWYPALRANIVYASPADDSANGPTNMLTSYPGEAVYSSKEVSPDDRLEIVLDLNREFTLGRLKLIWDDSCVPTEWAMDVSLDGVAWKKWVQGTSKEVDELSWWPGYEYFGPEPVQARFLRYRPLSTDKRVIKLRSLSVSR